MTTGRRGLILREARRGEQQKQQRRAHEPQKAHAEAGGRTDVAMGHQPSNTLGMARGMASSQAGTGSPFSFRKAGLKSFD